MMSSLIPPVITVVALVMPLAVVTSQRPGRILFPTNHFSHAVVDPVTIEEPSGWGLMIDGDCVLETLRIDANDFHADSVRTAVPHPGDYCVLPDRVPGSPHVVVVVGRDDQGNGVAEALHVDPVTVRVTSLSFQTYAGRDFVGVAFDPYAGRIAFLDLLAQEIIDGPWSGSSALPMASQLTVWDTGALPAAVTSDLEMKHLVFVDVGGGSPASVGQYFIGAERNAYSTGYFLINRSGQPAAAYRGTWFAHPERYEPYALADNAGAMSILVQGSPGSTVEVVRLETAQTVGAVTIPLIGWEFDVGTECPLSEALQIGDAYAIRYSGDPIKGDITRLLCVARHGVPGASVPSGLAFGRVCPPRSAYLGNPEFGVSVAVTGGVQTASGYYTEAMVCVSAMSGQNGMDPLVPNPWGGNALVIPVLAASIPVFIKPDGTGEVAWQFPLPSDPVLKGEVVLTQFLIAEAGGGHLGLSVAASEAVGVQLHVRAP